MFRPINAKNNNEFKAVLMKNSREELASIPKENFKNINFSFGEIDELEIEIPKFVNNSTMQKIPNRLYSQFKGKRQQIIIELNGVKSRWVVSNCEKNDEDKCKIIKAKSYESVLNEVKFPTESITRQLYFKEGDNDIADGILNFFEQEAKWKVGEVTEDARKQWDNVNEEFQFNLVENYSNNKLAKPTVIFDKDVNIVPFNDKVTIDLKINYSDFSIWEKEDKPSTTQKVFHSFDKFHTGVKHVKVEYAKGKQYSDAFIYTFTLSDGLTTTIEKQAPYMKDLKLTIKTIECIHTTGQLVDIYATKYRSFSEGIYFWYDFLMNDVAKAYKVIFTFDTYNKTINCYSEKEYGREIPLRLSYDNFIRSINKVEQYDELINKLYVKGKEGVSISEYNPLGTDYLYNFDYMVKNEIMSEELIASWNRYVTHCENVSTDLIELRLEVNTLSREKIKVESEIKTLDENIRGLESIRSAYMKENDTANIERLSKEINEKKDKYEKLLKDLQVVKDKISEKNDVIGRIVKSINIETAEDKDGTIFNDELISELNDITICKDIQDESYTTNYGLYNHAVDFLKESNICPIEFDIDIRGLLENIKIPNGLTWDYYLSIGDLIEVKDDDLVESSDFDGKVRIVKFIYYPSDCSVDNIELTNKIKKYEGTSKIADLGRAISNSNYIIKSKQEIIADSKNANDYMKKLELYGQDLAYAIKSKSLRVKFDFSEAGLFLVDGENEDSQICLTGALIGITNNRWQTVQTCIDETGIYARELIGQVILSKKLYIVSEDGKSLFIGEKENDVNKGFGIVIKDDEGDIERIFLGTELDEFGVRKSRLRLKSKDGELSLSEDGIINCYQYQIPENLSNGKPIEIPFESDGGISYYKEVIISVYRYKYRAYESATTGGGEIISTTSEDGGGGTSYESPLTSTSEEGIHSMEAKTMDCVWKYDKPYTSTAVDPDDYTNTNGKRYHNHDIENKLLYHHHNSWVELPAHSHSISAHSHGIPNHKHNIKMDTTHSHGLDYNIYESTMPTNIEVKVNGVSVQNRINEDCKVNITNSLKLNYTNNIEIHSETNGRCIIHIFVKEFRRF